MTRYFTGAGWRRTEDEDTYSCADCGLKTNYAGLCAGVLKPDPADVKHGELVCIENGCFKEREEANSQFGVGA
jgi:hypothetical protein